MRFKKLTQLVLPVIITVLIVNAYAEEGGKTRLFVLKTEHLDLTKQLWKQGDPLVTSAMKKLVRKAKGALKRGPYSVMTKKLLPPSGDKHDFFAIMGYCWPDPNDKNGNSWIVRDGHLNPDAAGDWKAFKPMSYDVEILGLAYYFTGDETYARHAALLLRTWFIDSATRMNPHAKHSKMVPGMTDSGYAVTGLGNMFRHIYDVAGILEASPHWTAQDHQAFQQWTRDFMVWVETSEPGKIEYKRDNNHGSSYDMIMALQAMYVGNDEKARQAIEHYLRSRFHQQFHPDGTQPWEMKRANNYDYHRANLRIAFDIAQLGDHFPDIDVWNFKTPEGASLRNSLQFLIPFFTGIKKWPYFSGEAFDVPDSANWRLLRRAALGFKDYSFEKAAEAIPGDSEIYLTNLIYPRAAVPGIPVKEIALAAEKNIPHRLFLLNQEYLDLTTELWKKGNKLIKASMKLLMTKAAAALKRGPYAVTDKKFTPPSGDKHDFFAYMGYAFPNPKTKDGLPWIIRDGHHNPKTKMDWKRIEPMAEDVYTLALAYYFSKKETYARHAALLLRTWFINKDTRMNPNVNYGKVIPGAAQGGYTVAGFAYVFRKVYDAAGILESSSSWTEEDRKALEQWTRDFMQWVETSEKGQLERKRKNNHGTFYDLNMALQSLYIGDKEKARQVIKDYVRIRLYKQFKPDGTQPYEMKRANNYDYHRVNLMIALDIAQLADHFADIDLWNYKSPEGGSLRKAAEFLIPYLTGEKKWPYFHGENFEIRGHDRWRLMQRAALGFADSRFDEAALQIREFHAPSSDHLVYPRLAITLKESTQ